MHCLSHLLLPVHKDGRAAADIFSPCGTALYRTDPQDWNDDDDDDDDDDGDDDDDDDDGDAT